MKKIYFLLLSLLILSEGYTQILTVIDAESKKPMGQVTISSQQPKFSTTTNADGKADVTKLQGAEKIEIRSLGFLTEIKSYDELKNMNFEIALVFSYLSLDEVVIAATKWNQSSLDIPSKITSITTDEIELQNPQTAADLLSISGKVYIQKSQQGGGSPMIRGFATNRLLYTVDGIRMNTAIFRGGNIQNVINLDPFATENTQVLFGSGSVIYGSDAIGGVMSFGTLTPQFSLSDKPLVTGKANTRYSTANKEKTGHFDVNVGWKKWALVTSFSAWDFDHLRQGKNGPEDYIKSIYVVRQDSTDVVVNQDDPLLQIPTAYSQINMMQKIRFAPNENWDFQYGFHYSETSSYGRYDRHNRMRNGTARYAEWNYGPQIWMMNNLIIKHDNDNKIYNQMTIRMATQKFEESRIDRSLNNDERNTQAEKVIANSINLDFIKSFSNRNNLFYGAEYVFNDITSTGLLTDISLDSSYAGPARYPKSTWTSIAFYLNDEWKANEKITLQAGIRYNIFQIDAVFDTTFYPFPFTSANINKGALTGSFGAVFRPTDKWIISTNLTSGFRSPNIDDLGKVFDSEPGAVTVPNPDLNAEYAYGADLSLAKVFGNILKVDVSGFYTLLQNALVRRDYQLNGMDSILYNGEMSKVQAIQNAAVANVYGIQAGFDLKLGKWFTLSSDINFQEGEEELDNGEKSPLRHAAPLFGSTRLHFKYDDLQLEFYSVYQGERSFNELPDEEKGKDEIYAKDANGNNYSPSWYTLNFKAVYSMKNNIQISGGIENITDQRYRSYSSGVSAPGRNLILSLKINF